MSLQKGNPICFGSTQVLQGWVAGWVERRKESHGFQTAASDLLFMTTGISSHLSWGDQKSKQLGKGGIAMAVTSADLGS